MRKIIYSMLFVSLAFTSCIDKLKSGKQTTESEEKAVETGSWELSDVADEFGDFTGDKCIRLMGNGTYSSELENDEKLTAILFVYQDYTIKMRLLKKGTKLVDDFSGHIKIKDGDGDVHDIHFTHDDLGQIEPYLDEKEVVVVWGKEISSGEGKKEFREIIEKEGVISAIAETGGGLFSTKYTYKFKFNLDGFKNAMRYLLPNVDRVANRQIDSESVNEELYSDDESESVDDEIDSQNDSEVAENIKFSTNELESVNRDIDSHNNQESTIEEEKPKVYDVVEEMPQFPRGQAALLEYLAKSIQYPNDAEENGIQGRVIVTFDVERDGSITDARVVKSVDPSLDKEAIRIINAMPKWSPGRQNGTPVRVKYTVPVDFRLQ